MERTIIYAVELRNLEDFTFNPGAETFTEKFNRFQADYPYFHFNLDQDDWKEAEKTLASLHLKYKTFYKIGLKEQEIKDYPVFSLAIPPLYELLEEQAKGGWKINAKELDNMPLAEDFDSGLLVMEEKVLEILQRLEVAVESKSTVPAAIRKKKYFITDPPKEMDIPMKVLHADAIREHTGHLAGTFYAEGSDDRFDLSAAGIRYVQQHHFVSSSLFEYEGKTYKKKPAHVLLSGTLAFALKKAFKQQILISPLTLNHI